jgi:hypothetical protein
MAHVRLRGGQGLNRVNQSEAAIIGRVGFPVNIKSGGTGLPNPAALLGSTLQRLDGTERVRRLLKLIIL